jgi:hypothetical protein
LLVWVERDLKTGVELRTATLQLGVPVLLLTAVLFVGGVVMQLLGEIWWDLWRARQTRIQRGA